MINLRKPAYGALVGLVVVVASACSSSAATPAAASVAPGATGAPGASAAASVAASTAANGDVNSLITQALSGTSNVKSFHIKLTVGGTIKAAALSGATGGAAGTGDLKLDGSAIEGDVDVAKSAAHIAVNIAPIQALGGIPITADVIMVDQVLYLKTALLGGAKYTKMDLGSLSSLTNSLPLPSLPVAVPSAGASGLAGLADMAALQKQLSDSGAKAEVVGTESIGGKDATHVKVTIPVDWINQQIVTAEAAASASPDAAMAAMKLDAATFDMWVYKSNNALAQMHLTAASSAVGNLDVMLTLTNYDQPVTISAPAASDIQAGGLLPGMSLKP